MVYSERCSITFVRAVLLKRKLKIDHRTPYSSVSASSHVSTIETLFAQNIFVHCSPRRDAEDGNAALAHALGSAAGPFLLSFELHSDAVAEAGVVSAGGASTSRRPVSHDVSGVRSVGFSWPTPPVSCFDCHRS